MGKIIKKRIEYGGSSNSAENIKYDDTKNVKEAIDKVKSEVITDTTLSVSGKAADAAEVGNKLNSLENNISDVFNEELTYLVGNLCIYNNALYKCITAVETAGIWDDSKWEMTTIENELNSRINNRLNSLSFLSCTESEYNGMATHDANTVYILTT